MMNNKTKEGVKMLVGIIVGHTKKSPGAYSKGLGEYEYGYNTGLASIIKAQLEKLGHSCLIEFRDVGGISGAFKRVLAKNPKVVVELHFNAANGKASGSECLHADNWDAPGLKEQMLAGMLAKNMSDTLGIKNRGIKERASKGERGFGNLMRSTKIATVLIESGFGDNSTDAKRMKERKNALGIGIANTVSEWNKTFS